MNDTRKATGFKQYGNRPEIIEFDKEGIYYFTVKKKISNKHNKTVYIGSFNSEGYAKNESAPKNCVLNTLYCLKRSKITVPLTNYKTPQSREYLDYLPYEGENLREIICMNDDAANFVRSIKDKSINSNITHTYNCIIIEPLYKTFSKAVFPTVRDKLDCMLQITAGLHQLNTSDFCTITQIKAHRDLKFANVVVDEKGEKPRIRLIDFSSVKVGVSEVYSSETAESALSLSNTAPEDLFNELGVSEKTDVFALGMMLAEIFSIWSNEAKETNPLQLLLEQDSVNLGSVSSCKHYYKSLLDLHSGNPKWISHALSTGYTPDWKIESYCPGFINLFESATRLLPGDRCTLEEFESELIRMRSALTDNEERELSEKLPFGIFLFDRVNLSRNKAVYLKAVKSIMESAAQEAAVILYGSGHEGSIQEICCRLEEISPEIVLDFSKMSIIMHSPIVTDCNPAEYSQLTGAIFAAHNYLKHENRVKRFNGEIHIFTEKPPIQSSLCMIDYPDEQAIGGTRILKLTAEDICKKRPDIKVVVHAFNGESENWYALSPLENREEKKAPPRQDKLFVYHNGEKIFL